MNIGWNPITRLMTNTFWTILFIVFLFLFPHMWGWVHVTLIVFVVCGVIGISIDLMFSLVGYLIARQGE